MAPSIPEKLALTAGRIRDCEQRYARLPGSVRLVAVSKTHPAESIRQAFAAGQHDFGENYLQEALDKMDTLAGLPLCWHFIGPIQSNKTRDIATRFDWVHSVDRERIARRLSEQRPADLEPLKVLLQVNISGEASKSGVAPEELANLAAAVAVLPGLKLCGLMAIPAPEADFEQQRQTFRRLADAAAALRDLGHAQCRELSMGMSADFEAAIAEGATIVRIGSDIFGPRADSNAPTA